MKNKYVEIELNGKKLHPVLAKIIGIILMILLASFPMLAFYGLFKLIGL